MKTRILWTLIISLPLCISCGDNSQDQNSVAVQTETRPTLVQDANGVYLDMDCLKQNADGLSNASGSGYGFASQLAETYCNVRNLSSTDEGRACAPTCQIGHTPYTSFYYPPSYFGQSGCGNVNVNFNNFVFGPGYNFNGYQMLGYNPQQTYNPYPTGYAPYSSYSGTPAQAFYYDTNYYNQPSSNQYCNSSCLNTPTQIINPYSPVTGSTNGCANSCWFATPTSQLVP